MNSSARTHTFQTLPLAFSEQRAMTLIRAAIDFKAPSGSRRPNYEFVTDENNTVEFNAEATVIEFIRWRLLCRVSVVNQKPKCICVC